MFIVSVRESINISTLYWDLYYRYNPGSQQCHDKWVAVAHKIATVHLFNPRRMVTSSTCRSRCTILKMVGRENTDIFVRKERYSLIE